jgi:serine/threonine protein kinase
MLQPFITSTHAKQIYRELKLLMYLNHPDAQVCRIESFGFFTCSLNFGLLKIVQLYNVFTPEKNLHDFQTLYVLSNTSMWSICLFLFLVFYRYFVFNYTDYDLNRVIRRDLPFSEQLIRLIIYQLLRGLKVDIYCKYRFKAIFLSFILI